MIAVKETTIQAQEETYTCACGNTENLTRNYYYVGGKGYVPFWECQDCLNRRWEESARAVEALKARLERL